MKGTIEIANLTKKYGDRFAVRNLNLSIPKGEIFGLLGPNGAGKSTTMLMLMGLTEPDSGTVQVSGINPVNQPLEVKRRVGFLPEDVGFYDDLTGQENLMYTGRLNGLSRASTYERAKEMLEEVGLTDERNKKAGKYSRGMRQRLGLANALMKSPEIIILDEPTLGIDPAGVRDFLEMITSFSKKEGLTIIFSSHNLYQVQKVCDRVGLFVSGELIACGNLEELSKQIFQSSAIQIDAGVNPLGMAKSNVWEDRLREIPEINAVELEGNHLTISCTRDVTAQVASVLVKNEADLQYLNKRELGLDDIYHRYFQGLTN